MTRPTSELAHLFRQLKAPAAAESVAQARRPVAPSATRRTVCVRLVDRQWPILVLGLLGAFAFYTAHFETYNSAWGSLSRVIVTMICLWLTSLALLFGRTGLRDRGTRPDACLERATTANQSVRSQSRLA